MPVKAPRRRRADTWWCFHGDVEVGGRFFANNPTQGRHREPRPESLGKYYEYSDIKPGRVRQRLAQRRNQGRPLSSSTSGAKSRLQRSTLQARCVEGRRTLLQFRLGSDAAHLQHQCADALQRPGHRRADLPAGLSNSAVRRCRVRATLPANSRPAAQRQSRLTAQPLFSGHHDNLYTTDIGIRRDTAAVDVPLDADRCLGRQGRLFEHAPAGTQVDGVVFSPGTSGVAAQVPKPVDDTTQNFGVNGEYAGTSPWGKKFKFKVGYSGSIYTKTRRIPTRCRIRSALARAPARANARATAHRPAPLALMSLWPEQPGARL